MVDGADVVRFGRARRQRGLARMVRSPRSRGSGTRHPPGRPGGARPLRDELPWRARATHASAPADIPTPHTRLCFAGTWGTPAEELAYKVDQAFAAAGVPYHPESYQRRGGLVLVVSRDAAARANAALQALLPPPRAYRPWGHRCAIEPSGLSKRDAGHQWVFELYSEHLATGQHYAALHFSDQKHRVFGRLEWPLDSVPHRTTLRKLAHRLVTDGAFREMFISHSPELAELWK
jgi:hypothetical protein